MFTLRETFQCFAHREGKKITHEAVSKTPQHLKNKERPSRCPSSCRSPYGGDSVALGRVSHLNAGVILVVTV